MFNCKQLQLWKDLVKDGVLWRCIWWSLRFVEISLDIIEEILKTNCKQLTFLFIIQPQETYTLDSVIRNIDHDIAGCFSRYWLAYSSYMQTELISLTAKLQHQFESWNVTTLHNILFDGSENSLTNLLQFSLFVEEFSSEEPSNFYDSIRDRNYKCYFGKNTQREQQLSRFKTGYGDGLLLIYCILAAWRSLKIFTSMWPTDKHQTEPVAKYFFI